MGRKPTYEELELRIRALEARLGDEKIEWDILALLAREWDTNGPPGIIDNRDLIARLGISEAEASPALAKLVEQGAVDTDDHGYAAFLTPEGYDLARHGPRDAPIADLLGRIRKGGEPQ